MPAPAFSDEQIQEIAERIANGEKPGEIAKDYDVHRNTISRLKKTKGFQAILDTINNRKIATVTAGYAEIEKQEVAEMVQEMAEFRQAVRAAYKNEYALGTRFQVVGIKCLDIAFPKGWEKGAKSEHPAPLTPREMLEFGDKGSKMVAEALDKWGSAIAIKGTITQLMGDD